MGDSNVGVQVTSNYKIKLKYGGYFRLAKNSSRKRYCFGFQKCIYIDKYTYHYDDLMEEILNHYPANRDLIFSTFFVDKNAMEQSFIKLNSHDNLQLMLDMYEPEKELAVYVTTGNNFETISNTQRGQDEVVNEQRGEEESEYSLSDESYHSCYSTDNEIEMQSSEDEEIYNKKSPTIKVNSSFDNVVVFKRALIHYAITNEFQYFVEKSEPTRVTARCSNLECKWRIHASVKQDGITFEVKTFVEAHSCTRSNKGGNKLASQGWIVNVIRDKLKSDGDVPVPKLQKWVMIKYNVDVSYMKVFRACSKGFRDGCRPYIALDACHLKGKFNGVLVAATSVDGNNSIFPVACGVLESENKTSWIWFLDLLKKAIGTPDGLVISSDMQKGLEIAITQVYPNVEHRECIRHLYSNFKRHFHGDFFKRNLWRAARTFNVTKHENLLNEIAEVNKYALTYGYG